MWYSAHGPSAAMKLSKRTGTYSASNVTFDPINMTATSFEWWYFVMRIGGKVVFNNYCYSSYTSRHQSKVRSLMASLGIKIDLEIEAPKGLQNLEAALSYHESKIQGLVAEIQKPRTRPEKNRQRAEQVRELQARVESLRKLIRSELNLKELEAA